MITIYGTVNQDRVQELMVISQQALTALRRAIERLEAGDRPALAERAALEALQAGLARLQSSVPMVPSRLD